MLRVHYDSHDLVEITPIQSPLIADLGLLVLFGREGFDFHLLMYGYKKL